MDRSYNPFTQTSASGAPLHPRLQLVHLGALIIIQFGDAVAFCARGEASVFILSCGQCLTRSAKDSEYRHRLELKSATDRTLGVGVVGSENAVLILTATTMLRASLDMDQIHNFNPEYVHRFCGFRPFMSASTERAKPT
jgi:nuclear pore complex protein Nup133